MKVKSCLTFRGIINKFKLTIGLSTTGSMRRFFCEKSRDKSIQTNLPCEQSPSLPRKIEGDSGRRVHQFSSKLKILIFLSQLPRLLHAMLVMRIW